MRRTIHRILALISLGLMLYLGVTGTLMQVLDLYALATHAPDSDPVVISMNEGRYGNGDIQVMTDADLTARSLPAELDYRKSLATVLGAMHRVVPGAAPRFVELRQARGTTIGQAMLEPPHGASEGGKRLQAFDATSGAPTASVPVPQLSLPPSFRQTLKEYHRFWSVNDVPGVYAELVSGLILWVLLITGLMTYYQLLRMRFRIKRRNPFWMAGGNWRATHRIVSVLASLCILMVAASGTWLGFESVWHTFASKGGAATDTSGALSDRQVLAMADATLATFHTIEPGTPIKVLRLRIYGGMAQGAIVTGGAHARQLLIDTATGREVGLTEPGYPRSAFPAGTQMHEDIKHLHSGMLWGLPTRLVNLAAGLSLIYLCISGAVMYWTMYRRRQLSGRKAVFWK